MPTAPTSSRRFRRLPTGTTRRSEQRRREVPVFLQVFQGRVADPTEVRKIFDDWAERLAPSAEGWLGSTGGVTDDGLLIGTARFESPAAARRNSDRPEQGEWWARLAKEFSGEVAFHDCDEVHTMRGGGSDDARFVQVIQSRCSDVARARELGEAGERLMAGYRPDLLGSVIGVHNAGDGFITQVAYFASEQAARDGERSEPPEALLGHMAEMNALMSEPAFYDLRDPWLLSARS